MKPDEWDDIARLTKVLQSISARSSGVGAPETDTIGVYREEAVAATLDE